jgi:hypothetical protein
MIIFINMYTYIVRQNKIVFSESVWGDMGGGRDKESGREWKILKNSSTYEYNIMHYTVSCWLLGEHSDKK